MLFLFAIGYGLTRLYKEASKIYRIERIAALADERKRGLGSKLVKEAEKKIKALGARKITLKSEDTAIEFYKKHDYELVGEVIMEYGYVHQNMMKEL